MGGVPISMEEGVYEFGDICVDVPAREVHDRGRPVHVQPKAFDVLVYLLAARDRVVTKDELLAELWPGEMVAETSLTFAIKAVRRAVGDDGTAQRVIRTLHGRGYRFVAEIRSGIAPAEIAPATPPRPASTIRDRILIQGSSAPFVGREDERRLLNAELALACGGQTRTVFVLGDPGVGKTRLAAEFASDAETGGVHVLVGRCDDGSPPAFWPWVQLVRGYAERHGRDAARALAGEGLPDLARLVPGLLDVGDDARMSQVQSDAEAEHARLRLFDSLVGFLREAARQRPLLVVLDDLQWADASSLLVLRHLMRELLDSRVLVLGTYRHMEVEPGGALSDLLGWLHRTRRSLRIRLVGLADEEVSVLVRALAGTELTDDYVAALGKVTDGNPFFVEEFCRDLASSPSVGGADSLAAGRVLIPEEVRGLLAQRVARLGKAVRQVLEVAAVLGREFRYDDLVATAEAEEALVAQSLEAAETNGLIRGDPALPGNFVFAHALVSEVLRESLGSMQAARLHRRAAQAIEARSGGDPLARATALAHHYSAAIAVGEGPSAFAWEKATGDLLLERFAYEDASLHYERALQLARDGAADSHSLYDLLLVMARSAFRWGDDARVRDLIFEAVEIARGLGSVSMLARAAVRTATLFPVTPRERVTLLEEAMAGLRADPDCDPRLLARVLSALASGLYGSFDEVHRREALVDEALEIARTTGDRSTLLRVLDASHVALWRPGYLERRLALAREHVEVAESVGNLIEMGSARTWYVPALIEAGDVAEADRQIEVFDREATTSRMLVHRANALSFRAMRALSHGCFDEVEFLAQRSYEMARSYNETTASMTLWSQIYYIRREQDRLAEIEAGIQLFASQVPQISWDWLMVHLLAEDGRIGEAAPPLTAMAVGNFRNGLPPDAHIVSSAALFGLAEACWRLRDASAARGLLPRLDLYRGQWVTVGLGGVLLGSMFYALGLALAAAGRIDEAVRALEDAEQAHLGGDVPLLLLRGRVELGCVLLERRDRASRTRARAMLEAARTEADRRGLVQLQRLIEAAGS